MKLIYLKVPYYRDVILSSNGSYTGLLEAVTSNCNEFQIVINSCTIGLQIDTLFRQRTLDKLFYNTVLQQKYLICLSSEFFFAGHKWFLTTIHPNNRSNRIFNVIYETKLNSIHFSKPIESLYRWIILSYFGFHHTFHRPKNFNVTQITQIWHQTCEPVILSAVSSNPTEGNCIF